MIFNKMLLLFNKNSWNHIACKLLILDKKTWNHMTVQIICIKNSYLKL